MSETLFGSSSEWMQLNQQTFDTSFGFSDTTAVTLTANSLSPVVITGVDHLAPKGFISKPIRRRSRASKRTAITLLNADAKNFRSLVQQFTGCRHRSTSISFRDSTRGPVNINFAHANAKNDHHYNYSTASGHGTILSQPFVDTKREQQQYECHYQYQQQLSNEEQEGEICFERITLHDDLFAQGFVMDDLLFLA
ncbi:uncharacterized protein LOC120190092 [Hibiscus syriacus]|uniref:uncharacterized protein LOC120190092 n=1 Tax=Hibiscus syriacus TaxID=106335 RepID=UPI0019223D9D|nr:uncharacterized protein LOC120190092 [Hibiscus syriacus]